MKNDEVKNVVDYCLNNYIIDRCYIQQVKEEFTLLAYFLNSFKPHNILEIGCKGRVDSVNDKKKNAEKQKTIWVTAFLKGLGKTPVSNGLFLGFFTLKYLV